MLKIDFISPYSLFMDSKKVGLDFFRVVWWGVANEVVEKAIRIYHLDEKQANALKKAYLKPNHYYAKCNSM